MRISDWSSDVCSSDLYLILIDGQGRHRASARLLRTDRPHLLGDLYPHLCDGPVPTGPTVREITRFCLDRNQTTSERRSARNQLVTALAEHALRTGITDYTGVAELRSEEHTSELQSLMRISYAVFCLKKKKQRHN